ncbi:hypothetical protein Selin_1000 [Desulfurispirillum indicum S5]|uniref:Uncharacterized protein n=1 Tax=Desulfurispirillum indicum (strain ATCC BAA-1389 / DSM 22839 / S5) TaxID=653733 RepID=E6W3E2_DESIS|nr:hypothetical protein [Desulfurispirillum indicum]ADU65735.1 hypothetical protein Selin_1000 [Desulfurispirillum indicum S5]
MDLESVKNLTQIIFWCGALILAYLTYRNARKTLLSPVNTEYQKRVFDSLTSISERLFSELKIGSDEHWIKQRPMKEVLDEICREWDRDRSSILEHGLELVVWPAAKDWCIFNSLADEVRYEIFLPERLRNKIICYLEYRAESAKFAHDYAVIKYIESINENRSYDQISIDNFIDIENYYIDGMGKMNLSFEQITQRNQEILCEITKYVRSFDPTA